MNFKLNISNFIVNPKIINNLKIKYFIKKDPKHQKNMKVNNKFQKNNLQA